MRTFNLLVWNAPGVLLAFSVFSSLLAGCTSTTLPASLDDSSKRVAVISLVSEYVTVTRSGFFKSEEASFDMNGQNRKTIERTFATHFEATRPNWSTLSVQSDFWSLSSEFRNLSNMFSSNEAKLKAQLAGIARTNGLDVIFVVREFHWGGEVPKFPGIGVILVGSGVSGVSQAEVYCTVLITVVDAQGNFVAQAEVRMIDGPKVFDRNYGHFSYNVLENLDDQRVQFMSAAVTRRLTETLKKQFMTMGI